MKTQTQAGITYELPKVTVLHATPLLTAEYAGRTAYDSFSKSEHECIRNHDTSSLDADHSELLDQLAWVHFHHSVAEHISINYLIEGTSRGVLQEIVRHRIASYTVRSTRYTMSPIINAFTACITTQPDFSSAKAEFIKIVSQIDFLVTKDFSYNKLEYKSIFDKLRYQWLTLSREEFLDLAVAKSSRHLFNGFMPTSELYDALQAGKAKRNCADNFKHIVSDNFKVDLVVTFNLRSLKNYIELRSSNSAWFQIHWLSNEMVKATPRKYLDLIVKQDKLNKILNKKENNE